jgi:hypothetical protein
LKNELSPIQFDLEVFKEAIKEVAGSNEELDSKEQKEEPDGDTGEG